MINPFFYSRTKISHEIKKKPYNIQQQYIPCSRLITEIEIMKPTSLFCDDHSHFSSRVSELNSSNHSYRNAEGADKGTIRQNPFIYAKPSRFLEIGQQHKERGLAVWQRKKYLMRQEDSDQLSAPKQISKFSQYRQGPPQKAKNLTSKNPYQLDHESQYPQTKQNLKAMLSFTKTAELEEQGSNQKLIYRRPAQKSPDCTWHEQIYGAQSFQLRKTQSQIRDLSVENVVQEYGRQFHEDNGRLKEKGSKKQPSLIHKLTKMQGKASTNVQRQKAGLQRGQQKINEKPPAYYDDQIFDTKEDEKFDFERHKYDSNETSKFRGTALCEKVQQYPSSLRFHNVVYDLVKII